MDVPNRFHSVDWSIKFIDFTRFNYSNRQVKVTA